MTLQTISSFGAALALDRALAAIPGAAPRAGEPLRAHTSMGVGGPARWFIEVEDRAALAAALAAVKQAGVPWLILGGGSNTLFDDAGFEGAVLYLGRGFRAIEADASDPHVIRAGAGATLGALMNFAKRRGLAGLEFCAGIPGVLGGALAGNAGAGGADICSVADEVEVLDENGGARIIRRGEFKFAYRSSELRRYVILGAALRLAPDSPEAIAKRIEAALAKRREQPVGERSSGCMFKNPPGEAAGRLIDQCGLKGLRVGGVEVSAEHANFMVNDGAATAADIRALMALVREKVRARTGIELEVEVRDYPADLPLRCDGAPESAAAGGSDKNDQPRSHKDTK